MSEQPLTALREALREYLVLHGKARSGYDDGTICNCPNGQALEAVLATPDAARAGVPGDADRLENDIRELRGADPGELARRLIERGWGAGVPGDEGALRQTLLPAALPPGTRLILAAEDFLGRFGTRTEDGYRITAEWGEMQPGGWYEPRFTVHADDRLAASPAPAGLDVERLARAFYDVTQGRFAVSDLVPNLPDWRDPSIEAAIWDKAVADGVEVAERYAALASPDSEAKKETPDGTTD